MTNPKVKPATKELTLEDLFKKMDVFSNKLDEILLAKDSKLSEDLFKKIEAFSKKQDEILLTQKTQQELEPKYTLVLVNQSNQQEELQIKSNVIPPVNTFVFITKETIYHVLGQSLAVSENEGELTIINEIRLTVRNIASKIIVGR